MKMQLRRFWKHGLAPMLTLFATITAYMMAMLVMMWLGQWSGIIPKSSTTCVCEVPR